MENPALAVKGVRVSLRELVESDAPALWAAVSLSREGLRRRFNWAAAISGPEAEAEFIKRANPSGEAWRWAVIGSDDGALAGVVSLNFSGSAEECAKLSFWIRADRQGRGYATEAVKLAVESGFKNRGLHRIFSRIDPANRPSRKVLQKTGFHYEGCLRDDKRINNRWVNQECWGLLKSEWKR